MANSKAVMGINDAPMWESMKHEKLALQQCDACASFRYPPASACPECLSEKASWKPVSGKGTILSWVIFHRKYFDDHVPPYNSVAIRLPEGPIIISQLQGEEPKGSWINREVELAYGEHAGRMQHYVKLTGQS
ncbi:OB-fold domain-containing protein [Herbaspirillum lusitanum]|uniref:OB-fold domain-containing protein n=1 Tax=Herbaspirillum lusitanum TaxID=213312 RepID=A0ABW9ABT0_9BURK